MDKSLSRRHILKTGVLAAIGASIASGVSAQIINPLAINTEPDTDAWKGLKMGIASYTFRKLSVEKTIKAMQRLDLKYVSIKDYHLPLTSSTEERKAVVQQFKDAGITPLSCGNITMKNEEADIRHAFEYARDCGIPTIVCSPDPDSMPILDRMVKEFDIKLAIHNHGPEDKRFPSPHEVYQAAKGYDSRIGLCIDVGHTARAKADPAECILKYKDRLYDLHLKDIESLAPDAATVAGGRGVLDLYAILHALLKIKYAHQISIEYESNPEDPYADVAETVGYAKGLLLGMTRGRRK
ncbi:MAG: sugar phosphate isomerase/epimerase [Flavitalea sp.]